MPSSEQEQIKVGYFPVQGMSCSACAVSVESILNKLPGVKSALVNFATAEVVVEYEASVTPEMLNDTVKSIGYGLDLQNVKTNEVRKKEEESYEIFRKNSIGASIFTIPVFVIGMFFMDWSPGKWVSMVLSTPVLFVFGKSFFISAFKKIRHGMVNMDTLVALSTGIAYVFSAFNTAFPQFWLRNNLTPHVYFEAATVIITFVLLGKMLEEKAKSNTNFALKQLIGLTPDKVNRISSNGEIENVSINEINKGNVLLIQPGEKIPVDGMVISGESYVDESMINGEPIPVLKQNDDKVFAGTINQKGSFRFKAEKVGKDTFLSGIIETVKKAQSSKAPMQKLADKIASIFVPTVLILSVLTFLIWIVFGGDQKYTHAFLAAVSVLVIACPCALGLATPTAIMVGIGKGAENHILIRNAAVLEKAGMVDTVVLDKTGTITTGRPNVSNFIKGPEFDEKHHYDLLNEIESNSEHPLAEAVIRYIKPFLNKKITISNFKSLTGKGVEAKGENGIRYMVGNERLVSEFGFKNKQPWFKDDSKENTGKTIVYFADSQNILAVIVIEDTIKEDSKNAIQSLISKNIDVIMLTGDGEGSAKYVASQTGIKHYKANQLPFNKYIEIEGLKQNGKKVAMVGDGINDAPALALADVSIAMSHGTDIAMNVSDITLIGSNLYSIVNAIKIAVETTKTIKQNLFWAFIYNLIGIPVAAGILYPLNGFMLNPMIAGGAMALSSVSVVLNSLRLKKLKIHRN
ncbi:MAG: copper-translocating P-type ATPase [Flavobacteriales bacterium]|nr:copper-translocating P-type ATPase [Flavobacteriales bacterium]